MKLRFKILLALMLPIIIILTASCINQLINFGSTLPQMLLYQEHQLHFFADIPQQEVILNKKQISLNFNLLKYKGNTTKFVTQLKTQPPRKYQLVEYHGKHGTGNHSILANRKQNQLLYAFFAVVVVFLAYVWRTSIVVGLSLEIPVQTLIEILDTGIVNLETQEFTVQFYEEYYNSSEIRSLYKTMIHFVNNIKYSNNKLWNIEISEAESLISLCKAAEFFKEYKNLTSVGICANNISKIHIKNKRLLEAMNEQELSLMIADQEIEEINQYKKLCQELQLREQSNIIHQLKRFKNRITKKMKLFDHHWFHDYFQNKQTKQEPKAGISIVGSVFLANNPKEFLMKSNPIESLKLSGPDLKSSANWIKRPDIELEDNARNFDQVDENQSQSLSPLPQIESQLNSQGRFFPTGRKQTKPYETSPVKIERRLSASQEADLSNQQNLMEIKHQKKIIKAKSMQRKYQLANLLFNYSLQNNSLFNAESIKLFKDVADEGEKLAPTRSLLTMQINIYTKKSILHIKKGNIINSMASLEKAEEVFEKLEKYIENLTMSNKVSIQDDDPPFIDVFHNTPLDVLRSKINLCHAIIDLANGRFYTSSIRLIEILQAPDYFDPCVEKFCVKMLKNIFSFHHIPTKCLNDYNQQLVEQDFELIILIDYTNEMSIEQLTLAHTMSKYILDQLKERDKIGLYAFNEILYESFPLQRKGMYRDLLEQQIKQLLVYPGGKSNLFRLLQLSAAHLFDLQSSKVQKKLKLYVKQDRIDLRVQMPRLTQTFETFVTYTQYRPSNEPENRPKALTFMGYQAQAQPLPPTQTQSLARVQPQSTQVSSAQTNNKSSTPQGDFNEDCIDDIINEKEFSDFFSDEEDKEPNFEIDTTMMENEEADHRKMKYICLFSEGVRKFDEYEYDKLKAILEKKNTHLIVFNIANQNANMLYLKLLSQATSQSQFFTSEEEMIKFFEIHSQKFNQKRPYLEFF